jgi:hypothetical protein
MSVEDNQITVAVRRRLVSAWVDVTRLNVRTTRGVVYVSGYIKRMTHEHSEMYPKLLHQLDLSLRSLKDVRDVRYNLENWERSTFGSWLPLTPAQAPETEPVATHPRIKTPETVDVTEDAEDLSRMQAENRAKQQRTDPEERPST